MIDRVLNNDNENDIDDDMGDISVGGDGVAAFIDDLSPNTINQLKVVTKRFGSSPGVSKVAWRGCSDWRITQEFWRSYYGCYKN